MLRASRRVLRPGGRIAFHTIQATAGLSGPRRRLAHEAGPPAVAVRTSYPGLLRSAGFTDIVAMDLTSEYRSTQQRWIDASQRHEEGLRKIVGDVDYEDRAAGRRQTAQAIDDGLLARILYTATR